MVSNIITPSMHVAKMMRPGSRQDDPMDPGIADLAEEQVHEEGEQDLGFWKFLEVLGRPQRAVSGVIFDAIDGGDFSPMDRVGQALLGEESKGMRDVLEEMFPGEWSQVVMPDWMPMVGGEEVDMLKGVTGFLGDVFTDPLMYVAPFALQQKLMRYGAEEAAITGALRRAAPGISKESLAGKSVLGKEKLIGELVSKDVEKIRAATSYQTGLIHHRTKVAQAAGLWDEVLENPELYKPHLPEELANKVDELVDAAKKRGGGDAKAGYARPTVIEQISEGQRKTLAMRLQVIGTSVGFKDFSIIPMVDKQLGIGLAKGAAKLSEHLTVKNKATAAFFGKLGEMFKYDTGNPELNGHLFKATNGRAIAERDQGRLVRDAQKSFKGHHDKAYQDGVMDYVQSPFDVAGDRRIVPEKYRGPVEKIQRVDDEINTYDHVHDIKDIKQSIGGPGPLNPAQVWANFSRIGRKLENAEKYSHGAPSVQKLTFTKTKREVDKAYRQYLKDEPRLSMAEFGDFLQDTGPASKYKPGSKASVKGQIFKDIAATNKEITSILGEFKPIAGYAYHLPTKEFKNAISEIAGHRLIRDTSIGKQFLRHTQERTIKDMTVEQANKWVRESGMDDDALKQIIDQTERTIKTTDDKGLRKLMNKLKKSSGTEFSIFVEDPILALHTRVMGSIEAVEQKDIINGMLMAGSRQIIPKPGNTRRGESSWLLSPRGMKAALGDDWRNAIGARQAAVYDTLVKEKAVRGTGLLDGLFLNSDHVKDIQQAHSAGIPVFGIDGHTAKMMERFDKIHSSPKEQGALLHGFDKFTNWWKLSSLAIFPGYQIRNVMYDYLRRFFGGTASIANDKDSLEFTYAAGLRSLKGLDEGTTIKRLNNYSMKDDYGRTWSGPELADNFHREGVGGTYAKTEFPRTATTKKQSALKATAKSLALLPDSPVIKAGLAVSHHTDLHQRTAHWLGKIKRGMTPHQAAMDTKGLYFAYSELTQFEKNVMRRALPFYSFTRKNLPLVAKTLVEKPGLYAQLGRVTDFMQSEEVKDIDKAKLPGYINENFGVPTRINKETGNLEVSMLRSWLGMTDLMTVMGSNPLRSTWRTAAGLLHPGIKFGAELAFNKNLYTEQELQKFPGEVSKFLGIDMPPVAKHGLRNIRLLSEGDRLFKSITNPKEDVSPSQAIWNAAGVTPKVRGYDQEKMEKGYKYKTAIRKSEIKRAIRWAKKSGDEEQLAYYQKMLKDATTRRKKR